MMGVPISWLDKATRIGKTMTVGFMRADDELAKNVVYQFGEDEKNVHFYELMDKVDDAKVNGKQKYKRLFIQEVFPCIPFGGEKCFH